jgi:hypothetical protein
MVRAQKARMQNIYTSSAQLPQINARGSKSHVCSVEAVIGARHGTSSESEDAKYLYVIGTTTPNKCLEYPWVEIARLFVPWILIDVGYILSRELTTGVPFQYGT